MARAFAHRPDSASMFKNRNRRTDKDPAWQGNGLLEVGKMLIEFRLSGWERESPKAGQWLALRLEVASVRKTDDGDLDAAFSMVRDGNEKW